MLITKKFLIITSSLLIMTRRNYKLTTCELLYNTILLLVNYSTILLGHYPGGKTITLKIKTYLLHNMQLVFFSGFWLKESTYREQAEVNFKHQFILLLQGTDVNTLITYSTYQNYNNLVADHVRIPFVQVHSAYSINSNTNV